LFILQCISSNYHRLIQGVLQTYAKNPYLSHTSGCFEGDKPQTIRRGQILTKRNRQKAVKYIFAKCNLRIGSSLASVYLTNRFHVAVHLFSNRSQMTSKYGKNKKVAHEAIARRTKLLQIKPFIFQNLST